MPYEKVKLPPSTIPVMNVKVDARRESHKTINDKDCDLYTRTTAASTRQTTSKASPIGAPKSRASSVCDDSKTIKQRPGAGLRRLADSQRRACTWHSRASVERCVSTIAKHVGVGLHHQRAHIRNYSEDVIEHNRELCVIDVLPFRKDTQSVRTLKNQSVCTCKAFCL